MASSLQVLSTLEPFLDPAADPSSGCSDRSFR